MTWEEAMHCMTDLGIMTHETPFQMPTQKEVRQEHRSPEKLIKANSDNRRPNFEQVYKYRSCDSY